MKVKKAGYKFQIVFSGKVNQVAVQIIEKQNQADIIIDMDHSQGVKQR
jgi:hypothetical protein